MMATRIGNLSGDPGPTPVLVGGQGVRVTGAGTAHDPYVLSLSRELGVTFVTTTDAQEAGLRFSVGAGGVTADWGDGTTETIPEGNPAWRGHTYTAGTYRAVFTGLIPHVGGTPPNPTAAQMAALVSVDWWDEGTGTTSAQGAFQNAHNLARVARPPRTVTNMNNMFAGAHAFNQDLGRWDVSGVTTMINMFSNAHAFNQDLSRWDVGAVTHMAAMFFGASAFDGDISGWNTGAVTDMNSMFFGASVFDQDIGGWNTSHVTDMTQMFFNASAFNRNLSGWDVDAVAYRAAFNLSANPAWVANDDWQPQWPQQP